MTNTVPPEPLTHIPPDWVTVSDYQREFCRRLPADIVAYVLGNTTLQDSNQAALQNLCWQPNVLTAPNLQQAIRLYNPHAAVPVDISVQQPLFVSPVAYHGLYHPDAERANALACQVTASSCIWSSLANTPFDALLSPCDAQTRTSQRYFQAIQWYWQVAPDNLTQPNVAPILRHQRNRDYNQQLLQRWLDKDRMNLPDFLVITVDAAHSGVRDFARRMNVQPPLHITTPNLPPQPVITDLPTLLANAPNWDDIAWLVVHCPVPVLLKGILRPDDAKHALAIGCAGVVVSNHGQRVLADSVAVAQVLPSIRQAIPDAIVLADGGVMSGSDIAKLRALGADMVGVGRLVIYGLALAGALGTAHVLRLLQEEWQITAALTGEHGLVAKNRLGGSTKTV